MSFPRYVLAAVCIGAALPAAAATWRVGPGEKHAKVSTVAGSLEPGDIVELTGDIEDSLDLAASGGFNRPITIRGLTRVEKGRIIRPRITLTEKDRTGIMVRGDHIRLEGLDITTADENVYYAVRIEGAGFRMRNCRVHHCREGVNSWAARGDTTIEFCEFDSNGAGARGSLYLAASAPGAKLTIQHCTFRGDMGGHFVKSRYPRNVIRYNWFENQFYSALKIINEYGMGSPTAAGGAMRPMHSDIVGNVFIQGWGPGAPYDILQLGGEEASSAGTEGDFNVAHNLFLFTRGDSVGVRVHGNVDNVRFYNNVFLEYGVSGGRVYERGAVFESPATEAFKRRRGTGEPNIAGANNWVSSKTVGIPPELTGTLSGLNPLFVDLINFDFRPTADSPLAAAAAPAPTGAVMELAPVFEPRRGIPLDLEPAPRRAMDTPAIGPFEAAAE